MLNGGEAQSLWKKFSRAHPGIAARYQVLNTYHTSRQAFIGAIEVREARMADLREKFAMAGRLLD